MLEMCQSMGSLYLTAALSVSSINESFAEKPAEVIEGGAQGYVSMDSRRCGFGLWNKFTVVLFESTLPVVLLSSRSCDAQPRSSTRINNR